MHNSNNEDWSKILPEDPQGADALWELSSGFGESSNIDVSNAWAQFEQRLKQAPATPEARIRRFYWKRYATAAAAAILLLFTINFFADSTSVTKYANVEASAKTVTLPDNTEVTLAEGAKLTVRMEEDARIVELLGTASFNVSANTARPFKLTTPELDLVVVGTEFEVRSGKLANVSVNEGHVRVRGRNEADWTDLYAGDEVAVRESLVVSKDVQLLAPKGTGLRFNAARLSQVVKSIESAHDINLVIPSKLANCSLTADFSENTVMEIASTLAVLFNAEMSVEGQTVELKGGRCQ